MKIDDGTGNSYQAKVDNDNNLCVRSISTPITVHALMQSKYYGSVTGPVTLTSTSESGIFYFKCNDTSYSSVLEKHICALGASTGGSGGARLRIYRNPTGGTLISGGTALTPSNFDFSSNLPAQVTVLKGADGYTITGGTLVVDFLIPLSALSVFPDVNWLLPNGTSYAVSITPPSGNSSLEVYFRDRFYFIDGGTS